MEGIRVKLAQQNIDFCMKHPGTLYAVEYTFVTRMARIINKRKLSNEEYNRLQVIANDVGKH